ncbi:MAG: ArnT family glycosyltransferase [Gaiellaceae bacterium]
MIAVALAILFATALAVVLSLSIHSTPALWLAVYVVGVAEVVVMIEVLSLFRAVTALNVLLAELALLAVAVVVFSRRRGLIVWQPLRRFPLRQMLDGQPLLRLLLVVVVGAFVYEFALAVFTPPNNWDSMAYHLSRAAAWYHHHGVAYVDAHTERENAYQPNAEILVLYTFLFAHADTFASTWQWLAGVASLPAIYLVARRLSFDRQQALFAALLFATLSQTALQATTTQNDLVAASLVVACVAFLATSERHRLWLAAVALGAAIGTKLTVAFALPALIVFAALLVPRREWLRLACLTAVMTAVFGSFGYILNVAHTGSPLGATSATAAFQQHSWIGRLGTLGLIGARIVVDPVVRDEDLAYLGPLGAVLVVPVIVLTLRRYLRGNATRLEAATAAALPLYAIALAYSYRFNPWIGRFMLTPAALVAALFGSVYHHRRYTLAVTALAIATLTTTVVFNHAKPSGIGDGPSIWTMTRAQAQAVQRPVMRPVLATVAACVPAHAAIGYDIGDNDWDYPLFGDRLTRRIVRLERSALFQEADRLKLGWVLIARRGATKPPSEWLARTFREPGLILLQRNPASPDVANRVARCEAIS